MKKPDKLDIYLCIIPFASLSLAFTAMMLGSYGGKEFLGLAEKLILASIVVMCIDLGLVIDYFRKINAKDRVDSNKRYQKRRIRCPVCNSIRDDYNGSSGP